MYVSATDLGYEAVIKGWLKGRKNDGRGDESDKLATILNKYFINLKILESVEVVCKEPVMYSPYVCKVINTLNLLTGSLHHFVQTNKNLDEAKLEKFVMFSLVWAIGGLFEANDRSLFHEFLWSKGAPIP